MIPRIAFDSENSFDKIIDLDIEVAQDDEIRLTGIGREAIGGDGKNSQFALRYIQETFDLNLNWQSPDIYNKLFFWNINFALTGDSFRYFPDQTDSTRFFDCILVGNNKDFNPSRAHPAVVEFRMIWRVRIIAISAQVQTDRDGYFP